LAFFFWSNNNKDEIDVSGSWRSLRTAIGKKKTCHFKISKKSKIETVWIFFSKKKIKNSEKVFFFKPFQKKKKFF